MNGLGLRSEKSALSWKTAATIAWRELRASKAKFAFVILSVAIGVAALIGVRGFSESFQKTLLVEARTIMAADLSARMFRQPTPQETADLNALTRSGIERTWITETVSMVSAPRRSRSAAGLAESGRSAGLSLLWKGAA